MSSQFTYVETFLDNLFVNYAEEVRRSVKGKTYEYRLLDDNYSKVIKSGTCYINGYAYSKCLDCNIYTITDVDTGEQIEAHQFKLKIKEVSK